MNGIVDRHPARANRRHGATAWPLLLLAACSAEDVPPEPVPGRWYTEQQVAAGAPLYATWCASCHGADGSATAEWRTPDDDGIYPPPPLNGTAHTWHHPLAQLDHTIAAGGAEYGGVMPGFGPVIQAEDRLAIIAWFQSGWPDDIYERWRAIDERSR